MLVDAEAIINSFDAEQGWNEATKLSICLEYIQNQGSNDTFKAFIDDYVAYDEGYGPIE